VIKNSST